MSCILHPRLSDFFRGHSQRTSGRPPHPREGLGKPDKIGRTGGRVRRVWTSEIEKIVYTLTSLFLLKIVYAYESLDNPLIPPYHPAIFSWPLSPGYISSKNQPKSLLLFSVYTLSQKACKSMNSIWRPGHIFGVWRPEPTFFGVLRPGGSLNPIPCSWG